MRSFLVLAVAAVLATGCAATTAETDGATEDAISTSAVKVLASDRAYPGDLVFANDKIYWSEARMVASGDPELDQQFAYWTGTLWSFNVSRSRTPKQVSQLGSPVRSIARVGDDVYFTQAGFVGKKSIAKLDEAELADVYKDYDHFEINEEDEVASSTIAGERLYVLRTSGELVSVKLDGSDFKDHLHSKGYASNLAVAGNTAVWLTASDDPNQRAVWRANLSDATPKPAEVMRVREASRFAVDGDQIYFGVPESFGQPGTGSIMQLSTSTNVAPVAVVTGLASVSSIVFDGNAMLFTGKKGTVSALFSVPKANLGANAQPKTVFRLKGASDILPTPDAIFVTSTALDDRSHRYDGSVVRLARSGMN